MFYTIRDPAAYVALVFLIISVQGVVWLIGRHSIDLNWWRSLPFSIVLYFASSLMTHAGFPLESLVAGYAASALLIWIFAGFLYEPELRQRILMALLLPLLAFVAVPLGLLARRAVFGY